MNAFARFAASSGLEENLIAAFEEVADETAEAEDEVPGAAMLDMASVWLASAKDAADAALAMPRQWAKGTEANE